MTERLEKAVSGWGPELPEWVRTLVAACDEAGSQNQVAERLGVSAAMVSNVIAGKYAGDMANIERRVRDVLMAEVVTCPVMRDISTATCLELRDAAPKLRSSGHPVYVRVARACQTCPLNPAAKHPEESIEPEREENAA